MDENTTTAVPSKNSSPTIKIVIAVIVIIVLVFAVWQFGLKGSRSENTDSMAPQPTNSLGLPPEEGEAGTTSYKDGTYSATGEYTNPASREEVDVTITLANGVVVSATFAGTPDNATTTLMQGKFSDGFEELVVGKPVDEIALTVVNGSSLTPKGFMDALNKIKAEAQS